MLLCFCVFNVCCIVYEFKFDCLCLFCVLSCFFALQYYFDFMCVLRFLLLLLLLFLACVLPMANKRVHKSHADATKLPSIFILLLL